MSAIEKCDSDKIPTPYIFGKGSCKSLKKLVKDYSRKKHSRLERDIRDAIVSAEEKSKENEDENYCVVLVYERKKKKKSGSGLVLPVPFPPFFIKI